MVYGFCRLSSLPLYAHNVGGHFLEEETVPDKLIEFTITELKPDSADYKNRLTLSGEEIVVGVHVPEQMFQERWPDDTHPPLTPQGLAYVMTEIDLAIQRGYALRKAEYDAILDGSYVKKEKRK
jgi:hypothetical protein